MAPTATTTAAAEQANVPAVAVRKTVAPSTDAKPASLHPLDDLTGAEHALAVQAVRKQFGEQVWFKVLQRKEPAKAVLAPYLDAVQAGKSTLPTLPRKAEVVFIDTKTIQIHTCDVDLTTGEVEHHVAVDGHHKPPLDIMLLEKMESRILSDPTTAEAVAELGLPKDTQICADPWIYGADTHDEEPAYLQFLLYMRPPRSAHDGDAFHYAYPLPFVPTVDVAQDKVVRMDWMYTGDDKDGMKHTWKEHFRTDVFEDREYMPHLQRNYTPRADLKPLSVVQPEGASFTVTGRQIAWQKWNMRISWNAREGLVLHDVRYDGRPTFYRLSVSEMTVPYGDPRPPVHRKQAFDLGDAGAGVTANSLHLGCDCLGYIHYFDGAIALPDGTQLVQKNVVCLHEQDMGIGMKHTNYRTNNAFVTRNRQLVLQTIITVANYEYIFVWYFDQAGGVHFETRATGVLSVSPIDADKVSPYGNVVAPGVLGTNHQHIFCLRIHPRIDGDGNTVQYEDSVTMPFTTAEDKKLNPYGTGYTVKKTVMYREGFADLDVSKGRVFKIVNDKVRNPISKRPRGFKLHLPATQLLLAHPDSVAAKRAPFAQHHVWVTRNTDEDENNNLWAAGRWTNQSRGKAGGVSALVARQQSTVDEDVVVWAVFGLTHNPRVEDFPIMPVENTMVSLKMADFYDINPAMDVPVSSQSVNKSTLHANGSTANGEANGSSCCAR